MTGIDSTNIKLQVLSQPSQLEAPAPSENHHESRSVHLHLLPCSIGRIGHWRSARRADRSEASAVAEVRISILSMSPRQLEPWLVRDGGD